MANSSSFVNLLASQGSVDLDSSEPLWFSSQCPDESSVKERRKWSPKEDIILIGAWLNTSKDPIVSNEQKAGAFWKRIVEYYNSSPLLVGTTPRELERCKQRWARINDLVCKFAGCYEMALREQRSGQNDNDVMKAALDIFHSDQKMKFNLEHTWRELRHDVKWCSTYLEKDNAKEKRKPVDSVDGHNRLWNDYFSEDPTFPAHLFRRRFRMNKAVFMRIVDCLSENVPFFQQRRDAVGRLGLSPLQKCTTAIRMLAYGCAADAVDEYLRLGESTTLSCLTNFTEGIIQLFGDEYLRRSTPEDIQRLLDIGEIRGFPGMIGSIDCTLNDINVLDRSPVFYDILQGRAPRVQYVVNGHQFDLAYYLMDGIYPKWSTFIQSISLPQGPKAELFAKVQEATRKDVERAFGVLQARFAIVKNPAILWDKRQIGMVMRTCIILHNMIVENEHNGYTQYDTSEFEEGDSTRSSHVAMFYSTDMPSNLGNMLGLRNHVRDRRIHEQLKYDLIENIWNKFGNDEDV
uniref:Myb-like domain-containing protein n=1 Tax=Brassica oleracea var. oleracea TaxID=109376 RepID=A0A0D3AXP4_BRAOL